MLKFNYEIVIVSDGQEVVHSMHDCRSPIFALRDCLAAQGFTGAFEWVDDVDAIEDLEHYAKIRMPDLGMKCIDAVYLPAHDFEKLGESTRGLREDTVWADGFFDESLSPEAYLVNASQSKDLIQEFESIVSELGSDSSERCRAESARKNINLLQQVRGSDTYIVNPDKGSVTDVSDVFMAVECPRCLLVD